MREHQEKPEVFASCCPLINFRPCSNATKPIDQIPCVEVLAWIRTFLALLGFGFTFAKYIHSIIQHSALKELNINSPRTLGLVLMALGVMGMLGGVLQYMQAHRHMKGLLPGSSLTLWSPTLTMAIILLISSAVLTGGMILKFRMW